MLDVGSGRVLEDTVRWSKFSGAAWLPDATGFFYARYAEPEEGEAHKQANYNQQLWLHRVGTPQSQDRLIYARPDHPEWGFAAEVTEDGEYLVLHVWHGTDTRNRLFYLPLAALEGPSPAEHVVELISTLEARSLRGRTA